LNVNKKTMTIVSGVATGILALSACGSGTYDYQVSGAVQAQQLDYDCPNENVAMEAVAFVAGKGGGKKSGGGSAGKKSSDKKADSDSAIEQEAKQEPVKKPTPTPSAKSGTSRRGTSSTPSQKSSPKPSPTATKVKNKGVKLKQKPEKPEKLKGKQVPKLKYKVKPHGCETEYEIFVLTDDGDLYEQDVRQVDYEKCLAAEIPTGLKSKLFPLCTEG